MSELEETDLTDSGYDCDHCGGEIYITHKLMTGRPAAGYYLCRRCGCEWTLKGDVLHIGVVASCRSAQKQRIGGDSFSLPELPAFSGRRRILWGVGVVILLLVLLRFGGLMLFRFLLPLLVLGVLVYLVFKYGREQMWW